MDEPTDSVHPARQTMPQAGNMSSTLLEVLHAFTDPENEAQLHALDVAIQALALASCGQAELQVLFDVFERFAEHDGYGVFWSILHMLEVCDGCTSALLASVRRKPCEFNVLMINRLLNAGLSDIDGQSLENVLQSVLLHPDATAQALDDAAYYLALRNVRPVSN